MSFESFLFVLTGGVVLGALYALMAAGLAVVWTTLGIFNFSHGAFVALGAYIGWQVGNVDGFALGHVLGLSATVLGMFALGILFQQMFIRPFERKENIVAATVITTLAGATVLQNGMLLIWGPRSKQISGIGEGSLNIGPLAFSWNEVALIVLVAFILGAVGWFLSRTRTGRSMRAVSQNRQAAELMGLNVPLLYALAFGLSAAMAGVAGYFVGSVRFINPTMGADPLMKALIVVIFGGIARFTSPIYAALIVGLVESFTTFYLGLYWAPAVLFAMMMIVLTIKPAGLFGTHQRTL
ncbi:branched-chain amino acid ABC transporter permease [uncultured Sulfitobacter sp.]|uniref:branched-chain amino acid ABC transporter permease n=1 Tax=uncultured Sulfitobacter sp. TaxID=191468 RepID=UPI00260965A5|nr:branched-chain amino acid ABC transporter permease [uncultured Sulfitobacter sp.]